MQDITKLLNRMNRGELEASEDLWQAVYDALRQIAAKKMSVERPEHTLNPTDLVHEAYLRLVPTKESSGAIQFDNRRHFFSAAAEAMRRILVDSARRKRTGKRGGDMVAINLDLALLPDPEVAERMEALNEALDKLSQTDSAVAELVKLRYFIGMTIPEASELLNVSPRTAGSWWAYARAWLLAELGENSE